jgi:hypothetical protein
MYVCLPYNEEPSIRPLVVGPCFFFAACHRKEDSCKGMQRDVLADGRDKGSLISSNLCKYGALCRGINLPLK